MPVILPLKCVVCGRRLDVVSSMRKMPEGCPDCHSRMVPAGRVRPVTEADLLSDDDLPIPRGGD